MNAVKIVMTVNTCVPILLDLICAVAAQAIGWLQMVLLAMVNKVIGLFVHGS